MLSLKSSGQPLKGCPQGSDKVIRSDLGTKQRMYCSRMKMDRLNKKNGR